MKTKVIFNTIPRSGHGVLMNALFSYDGDGGPCPVILDGRGLRLSSNITYCDSGVCKVCARSDRKNSCLSMRFPLAEIACLHSDVNIMKRHYYHGNYEKHYYDNNSKYNKLKFIIQYRNPLETATSHWFLFLENKSNKEKDDIDNWHIFFKQQLKLWKEFVYKWLIPTVNDDENIYTLSYLDLLNKPMDKLSEVILFCGIDDKIDTEKLKIIVDRQDYKLKRSITEFKYYDENLFR